MYDLNSHYKDRKPEETIKIITDFFESRNFNIQVKESIQAISGAYWCSIQLFDNQTNNFILSTTGKGIDSQYSLASGYAELYERFCAKQFLYSNPFLYQRFQKIEPPDSFKHIDEIRSYDKILDEYLNIAFNNKDEQDIFVSLICNNSIEHIPCFNFINLVTEEKESFCLNFMTTMTASTGLAAGNTLEEALVQGCSEWCERYVLREILSENFNNETIFNEIDKTILPKNLQDIIINIENYNNHIKLIDLSNIYNMPVCLCLLINFNTTRIEYMLGSHPVFEIAIERCLTELYQGIYDNLFNMEQYQVPFKELKDKHEDFLVSAGRSIKERIGIPEILLQTKIVKTKGQVFINNNQENQYKNTTLLLYYKKLFEKLNINIFYRDISLSEKVFAIRIYSNNYNIQKIMFKQLVKGSYADKQQRLNIIIAIYNLVNSGIYNIYDYSIIKESCNILKIYCNTQQKQAIFALLGNDWFTPFFKPIINISIISEIIKLLQTGEISSKDIRIHNSLNNFYFMIYKFLQYNYSLNDIKKIINNFNNDNISNEELELCCQIEYIIWKLFVEPLNEKYNNTDIDLQLSRLI